MLLVRQLVFLGLRPKIKENLNYLLVTHALSLSRQSAALRSCQPCGIHSESETQAYNIGLETGNQWLDHLRHSRIRNRAMPTSRHHLLVPQDQKLDRSLSILSGGPSILGLLSAGVGTVHSFLNSHE